MSPYLLFRALPWAVIIVLCSTETQTNFSALSLSTKSIERSATLVLTPGFLNQHHGFGLDGCVDFRAGVPQILHYEIRKRVRASLRARIMAQVGIRPIDVGLRAATIAEFYHTDRINWLYNRGVRAGFEPATAAPLFG